jgi:hypothetical protein
LDAVKEKAEASKLRKKLLTNWKPLPSHAKFFLAATCDQARMNISNKNFELAEKCLKRYFSQPRNSLHDDWLAEEDAERLPLALLSEALASNNHKEEARPHFFTASKPDRNQPVYGIQAAETAQALGDAALSLNQRDRARRFYFEAYKAYADMDGFKFQADTCKSKCNALL